MLLRHWLSNVLQAEADTSEGNSGYSLTDPGDDRILEKPTEETTVDATTSSVSEPEADETEGDGKSTEANDESGDSQEREVNDDLLDRAASLGLEWDDIKRFRTDHTLRAELDRVERVQQRFADRQQKPEGKPDDADENKAPDFDAILTKQRESIVAQRAKIKSMRESGYDEDQMALYEDRLADAEAQWEMLKYQNDRAKQLETINQELMEFAAGQRYDVEAKAVAKAEEEFESAIAELGDEYGELFGDGPGAKMDQKGQQFKNRQILWEAANEFADLAAKRGQEVNIKSLVRKALAAEFSDRQMQVARAKLKSDMKKAGGQAIVRARPAGDSKGLSGEQAALAKTEAFMSKMGG